MRSLQSRLCVGPAWMLVCAATRARAVATISVYEAYMSAVIAIGGLLLGVIVAVLIMCDCWEAAAMRLQPRERRMWELPLPNGLTGAEVKVLEKLHDEADATRKKKKKKSVYEKGQSASAASANDSETNVITSAAGSDGRWATLSPGVAAAYADSTVPVLNPYLRTEDDVVSFNDSLPSKFVYM